MAIPAVVPFEDATRRTAGFVVLSDVAAYNCLTENSGKLHIVPAITATITLSLPSPEDGLEYHVTYCGGAAEAQDIIIDTGSDSNYFVGGLVQSDTDDLGDDTATYYSDGNSNSKVTVKTPGAGCTVSVYSNGVVWYINGQVISATDTGVVFADQ